MHAPKRGRIENLRPPMQPGEPSRNPEGRNQYTADRELRLEFRAICRAINEGPEPVAEEIYEHLARALATRLTAADRGTDRLLLAFLDREWPVPDPDRRARQRENSLRRLGAWVAR